MNLAPTKARRSRGALLRAACLLATALATGAAIRSQEPGQAPPLPQPAPSEPAQAAPVNQPSPAVQTSPASPDPALPGRPIAIVPLDSAATVTGAALVHGGHATITTSGSIASGEKTTDVVLPYRGTLRVCTSSTIKVTADNSVPAGETPGLMMALDHGAIEASFATARNSDILLTPDFRILIGGPGAADVKVRLGQHGDTCVDNAGKDAPYVLVTSVFDGGAYRVQPGQRVMFQHGSLEAVVDQEKEPCGCPEPAKPETNEFPVAQSAGLAPLPKPAPDAVPTTGIAAPSTPQTPSEPLVYEAAPTQHAAEAPAPKEAPRESVPIAQPSPVPAPAKKADKPGFFHRVGRFFKRLFGAE